MGRWLWDVGNVRNELIRGETGWSTFEGRRPLCARSGGGKRRVEMRVFMEDCKLWGV